MAFITGILSVLVAGNLFAADCVELTGRFSARTPYNDGNMTLTVNQSGCGVVFVESRYVLDNGKIYQNNDRLIADGIVREYYSENIKHKFFRSAQFEQTGLKINQFEVENSFNGEIVLKGSSVSWVDLDAARHLNILNTKYDAGGNFYASKRAVYIRNP